MGKTRIIEKFNREKILGIIREKVRPGMTIAIPTFFSVGVALDLVHLLAETSLSGLKIISNDTGLPGLGVGRLIANGQVEKLLISYIATNPEAMKMFQAGKIDIDLYPQGTLVEMLNCGGKGIGGFYTPTGVGTAVEGGRETRIIGGRKQIFFEALRARVGFIKAYQADRHGNVAFHKTARNFNEAAAQASDFTIIEVDKIVERLDPDRIHLQCAYADVIVKSSGAWKKLLTVKRKELSGLSHARQMVVKQAARLIKGLFPDGAIVNLGIGTPLEIASLLKREDNIMLMSENGLLGMGPPPDKIDHEIVNAGRGPASVSPGGSFFDSVRAFGLIRGGRVDATVLGGYEVSATGDLANYTIPGKSFPGIGGGMDLVTGAKTVIIATEHTAGGKPKILKKCTLPLTGQGVVKWIVTDLALIEVAPEGLVLHEVAPIAENLAASIEKVRSLTDADLRLSPGVRFFSN
ncbi:MAG: 3-oxoacid CoA-transferase subunit A [Candidatus Falkowbacteria bacterium]